MMLYNFIKLKEMLDELGYPEATSSLFQVIKRDLTEEEDRGNIEYKEDGIYYTLDGVQYKGYLYLKVPNVEAYGYPRFHVVECQTIVEQKRRDKFRNRYYWHNNNVVDLHDRESGFVYEDVALSLCKHCQRQISEDWIETTQDFFDQFDADVAVDEEIRTGIGGYVLNWHKISSSYREKTGYQCEHCSTKVNADVDKRFIHVHHKDGNKLNNKPSNLEALCVLCHANVDGQHKKNFNKHTRTVIVESFVKRYYIELAACGNPHLTTFGS